MSIREHFATPSPLNHAHVINGRPPSDLAAYYLLLFTTQRNISEQRSQIVNLLVAKGVDVNLFEPQGKQTPLHLAAINGYAFVCK